MKLKKYGIVLCLMLALSSCDSLDLTPIDYSAAGNYWKNESHVTTYINGIHSQLRADYNSLFLLGEARGGTLRDGTSSLNVSLNYATIITNMLTKDNTGVSNWNGYYARILQVNHLIDQVENHCDFLSDAARNQYLGQAYGIRAYYYFMLYRTYGGVPIETDVKVVNGNIDVTALYKPRSTAEETLDFIKSDINKSEKYFGNTTTLDRIKWSKYATLMLKADIYMWSAKVATASVEGSHIPTGQSDLQIAKTALQEIVNSGKFSLLNNYADIFRYDNKKNNEVIFEFSFSKDEALNNGAAYVYQPSLFVGSYYDEAGNVFAKDPLDLYNNGMGRIEYKESFVKSFDRTDSRRNATFFEFYSTSDPATRNFGSAMIKQLGHAENGSRYWDSDIIVYRYADVLLRLAECENGLGQPCASYINQVRQRAYGGNFDHSVTYTDGDYAQNELAILHERDKEFVSEGMRWFDVVRLHDANKKPLAFSAAANYPTSTTAVATPLLNNEQSHKLLWPIDTGVLSGDNLIKQTVGYEN